MIRRSMMVLALGLLLVAGAARADDVDVELHPKVLAGSGLPTLTVRANVPVAGVELQLEGGGKTLHRALGPLKRSGTARIPLDPGTGAVQYHGTLTVKYPASARREDAQLALEFVAEVVAPLVLTVAPADVDLEQRRLVFTASRTVTRAELTLTGLRGAPLAERTVELPGAEPGRRVEVAWPPVGEPILKLHLQVFDADGFYGGVDLFPWRVDVPHDEVVFESGSATIPEGQTRLLDAALAQMRPQVQAASRFVEVRLYVVGHTDTVGSAGANQQLSEARARAIAGYFRSHGLAIATFYAGLGERGLRVPTPDETPEPRNRRAEYILTVTEPAISGAAGALGWKRL